VSGISTRRDGMARMNFTFCSSRARLTYWSNSLPKGAHVHAEHGHVEAGTCSMATMASLAAAMQQIDEQ